MAYKKNVKELILRIIMLFVGLTVAHLGVTLFLLADLGSDPFNVFIQGIFRNLQLIVDWSWLTHGRTHMAVSFLIILILLIVDRSYIKIGTILCMFCGGPIIDFFTMLLQPLFTDGLSLFVLVPVNALGCVILALGMTIVIQSEAGTGPNDLVAVVIADKSKKKFGIVRIIVDVCWALIGFLLGGTIGIGTIICAFVVGPVAGVFLPYSKKLVDRVVA